MKLIDIVRKIYFGQIILLLTLSISSCKKFVNVNAPVTSVTSADVYNSNATAIAALTGIYTQLSGVQAGYSNQIPSFSMWAGLSADELTLWSGEGAGVQFDYFTNQLSATTTNGTEFWTSTYPSIFICNAAISGLENNSALTPAVQQQLLGEAKFMRAFFYFYLVNLYGDVPMPLTTNYKSNAILPRTPQAQVYDQIILDLKDAQSLLSQNFLGPTLLTSTTERVRPTKWAAEALLARTYLYAKQWANAEAQADSVINNVSLFSLTGLDTVFLSNSNEAIWQLQPVSGGSDVTNTQDGYLFIIPSSGPNSSPNDVYLNTSLLNSFEQGDLRRVNWVDSIVSGSDTFYFPYKYKVNGFDAPVTEYLMILRLGEQYLIRAEARAQNGNIAGAQADLNKIRTRAGLTNTTANSQSTLLTAILHERQVEMFTELGHRWLDLKRTGSIDSVMTLSTPQKSAGIGAGTIQWNTNQQLYPLPLTDIQEDQNLVQNPGY